MKYTFSISKKDYAARLAEIEVWLHKMIEYHFGWLDQDHYYIILDDIDAEDATMYSLQLGLTVFEVEE